MSNRIRENQNKQRVTILTLVLEPVNQTDAISANTVPLTPLIEE